MVKTPTAHTRRPRVRPTGSPVRMPTVPWDKYPGAKRNPALERAVLIHYAQIGGMSRAEAVGLADQKAHRPEKGVHPLSGRFADSNPTVGKKVARSRPASKPRGKSKR